MKRIFLIPERVQALAEDTCSREEALLVANRVYDLYNVNGDSVLEYRD